MITSVSSRRQSRSVAFVISLSVYNTPTPTPFFFENYHTWLSGAYCACEGDSIHIPFHIPCKSSDLVPRLEFFIFCFH
jgi:hypothetical protein